MNDLEKDFEKIIINNKYVLNCSSNKKRDIHSLAYLIDYNLSQSDCIKLDIGLEFILKDFILEKCNFIQDIKPKNKKDENEKDHLFIDNKNKIVYFAEIKSNLNLDTEKSKSTYMKCLNIEKELQKKYSDYTIIMFLVCSRYYTKEIIPKNIKQKYLPINKNLVGLNEYFEKLSIKLKFENENEYKNILNLFTSKMFKF